MKERKKNIKQIQTQIKKHNIKRNEGYRIPKWRERYESKWMEMETSCYFKMEWRIKR